LKAVKGIYENGKVEILEDPGRSGRFEVYVLIPELGEETHFVPNDPKALLSLSGFFSLGGDALEDTERVYE
jgi:hypothetical protein